MNAAPTVIHADWPAPPGVVALATTRQGGVSTGPYASLNLATHVGDDPAAVAQNRARLHTLLRLPGEPCWLEQVHGTEVLEFAVDTARSSASDPNSNRDREPGACGRADAAVTVAAGRVLAVLTADCLPVVFASAAGDCVGIAHAGWRGLAAGVLERTAAAMGCAPEALVVWLGPAIGAAAYEIGAEVREAFLAADPGATQAFTRNARGRWQADLAGLARRRLARLGVRQVHGGTLCSHAHAEWFFSHRREAPCGRFATFVWRTDPPDRRPVSG